MRRLRRRVSLHCRAPACIFDKTRVTASRDPDAAWLGFRQIRKCFRDIAARVDFGSSDGSSSSSGRCGDNDDNNHKNNNGPHEVCRLVRHARLRRRFDALYDERLRFLSLCGFPSVEVVRGAFMRAVGASADGGGSGDGSEGEQERGGMVGALVEHLAEAKAALYGVGRDLEGLAELDDFFHVLYCVTAIMWVEERTGF